MKWVADENIDRPIVERLRRDGHAVWFVCEMDPGISDDRVLAFAASEAAILLTTDKDFGELVFRQGLASEGVVLLRLGGLPAEDKATMVSAIAVSLVDELPGSFTVLTPRIVRVRRRRD